MDYATFRNELGKVLRRRRKDRQLTQVQLAGELGIDQANITRLERGKQGFDSETIFRIAQELHCTLTEIFHEVEQVKRTSHLAMEAAIDHDESLREIVKSWSTINRAGRGMMLNYLRFTKEHFSGGETDHSQPRRRADASALEVANAERAIALAGVPKLAQRTNADRRVQTSPTPRHRRK